MSSDGLTKQTPTEDKLDSLIYLVQQIAVDIKALNARVDSLDQKVDALNTRVDLLDQKVDALNIRVDSLEQKVDTLNARVDLLDQKVDARLHETRPIWEGVLARLEDIEINMDKVRAISHETRADLRELRRELKDHLPALK